MEAETRETWADTPGSGPDSLLRHRFFNPPYGYVIGVFLWPVFLSLISVWAVLLQSGLPSIVSTVGGLVVGVGGFILASMSSALLIGVTAWNTPYERIRRQFAFLFLSLGVAVLLFGLYRNWPMIPFGDELGLSAFAAHELSKIALLGPAIGFAFAVFALTVLGRRTDRLIELTTGYSESKHGYTFVRIVTVRNDVPASLSTKSGKRHSVWFPPLEH